VPERTAPPVEDTLAPGVVAGDEKSPAPFA